MGICGGGGGYILPQCDSSFIAVTSSVKSFLQLYQMVINFHGFKMRRLTSICGNREDSVDCSKSNTEKPAY